MNKRRLITPPTSFGQEQLQLTEEESRAFFKLPAIGVAQVSPEGRYIRVNRKLCEMLGYSEAELLQRTIHDVTHPDDRDISGRRLSSSFTTGDTAEHCLEKRYIRKNGTILWGLVTWTIVRDANGEPLHSLATIQDISVRRLAEEALRAREAQLRAIIDNSSAFIFVKDVEGRYLQVNRWYETMRGLTEGEMKGKTDYDLFPKEIADGLRQNDQEVLAANRPIQFEEQVAFNDAMHHFVAVKFPLKGIDGKAYAICGIATDITEHRQAVEALRDKASLLDLTHDTVMVRDSNDVITFWNRGAEEMYGWTAREAVGRVSHTLLQTKFPKPLSDIKAEMLRVGRWDGELIHCHRDGTRLAVASRWTVQRDDEGRFTGALEINNDISKRKEAEEALRNSEQLNQSVLGSLGANIAVLDRTGNIIAVNTAWRRFALDNKAGCAESIGINYLDVCRRAERQGDEGAGKALNGIQNVLDGTLHEFQLEYPCHSPDEKRWFLMSVTPLTGERGGAVVSHTNITERKRIERALQESEERLQLAMEAGEIGTFDWNVQTNEVFWTEQSKATFGQPFAASRGAYPDWAKRVHPEDLQACEQSIREAIRKREHHWQAEYRMTEGHLATQRWINSQGHVFYGNDGEPLRMIGINMDVTERKQAEEAIRQSESRFRQLAEAMPQIVYTLGPDGMTDYANQQWYEYTGASPDESMGRAWKDALHPDDRERTLNCLMEALNTRCTFEIEYRLRRRDGQYRWHLSRAIPIRDAENQVIKWIGTSTDIHDRKQAEAEREELLARERTARAAAEYAADRIRRLQAVTDSAFGRGALDDSLRETLTRVRELIETDSAAILLIDSDGQSLIVRATVGLNEGAQGVRIAIGEGIAGTIASTRTPLLIEDLSRWNVTDPVLRKYARSLVGAPLLVEGRLIGVIHADAFTPRRFTDSDVRLLQLAADRIALAIEQTRFYEVERQARRQAEEANRMKDEFLALVSHELRSPLNAMIGYARLLRYGPLDAQKVNRAADVIERGGKAQTQLIDDLLDTARIISGKLRLEVGPVDLVTVIEEAVQTIYPAADAKGIRIETDLNPRVGQITGDAGRLQQVIWNLLSNSVKFTPSGGRVDVRLERVDPHICITVSDTGKGISGDFLPYVFDRFRQADASSARRYGGLGLGLALVKYLVELHGGTIEAFSPGEGKGATFKVLLPVRAVSSPETEHATRAAAAPEKTTLSGLSVLVVDDEDDARELVKTVIAQYGADVIAAASAAEAFDLITRAADEERPDVMVTDLGLPGEDGYSLLRRLRKWERERSGDIFIPAIALTAYGRSEDRTRALKAGFQLHIAKPVEPEELAVVLASVMNRPDGS